MTRNKYRHALKYIHFLDSYIKLKPSLHVASVISGAIFSSQGVMFLIVFVLTLYIACNLFFDVRVPALEKRAVLITGCDSGFGYELAKKLDALGLRVFAACLTSEGEAKLTSECSCELRTFKLDVTKSSDIQTALEVVKSGLPSQGIQFLQERK